MIKKTENSLVEGLERLGLIASRIRQNQNSIPQIEIDIILQELRDLYMVGLLLEKENDLPAVHEVDESAMKVAEEAEAKRRAAEEAEAKRKAAEEAEAKRRAAEEAEVKRRAAEEAEAKRRAAEEAEAKRRAAEEAEAKRKAAEEASKPVFAPSNEPAPAPMPESVLDRMEGHNNDDLFSEPAAPAAKVEKEPSLFSYLQSNNPEGTPAKRTLADTLGQHGYSMEDRLVSNAHNKKVEDLRQVIGINDKFSFMSELFGSNMKGYNDFILRLNAITDRQEAKSYVDEVAAQHNWNEGSVVVKTFWGYFDRKF